MKCLLLQLQDAENEIQSLGSLFSTSVESAGTKLGIGVVLLLCHLELLGISWNLIGGT